LEKVVSETAQVQRLPSFAGDVLKLVSGTAVAQLLGILASPILTRLYAPEAFGLLALFTSITSIVGVIACMRYELAIMLPESDEEAVNLLGVSLLFTTLLSLLTVPLIWWGRDPLLRWLDAPELARYLWLTPPMVFFSGVFLALNYWNSRTKQFGRLSIARVSNSVATTSAQLGLGFTGFVSGGSLIGAMVGGKVLATAVLGGQIWRDDHGLFLRAIYQSELIPLIKRYRKFPLYDTWSALLNSISWQLPTLMLSSYFSTAVVGYYALGYRILQLPMSFIGGAIGQVFFQRVSEAQLRGELTLAVEQTFRRLVMIGLFPMLTLAFIGRDLFILLFGTDWAEAGVYTQILSVWAFLWFISSPLSTVFSTLQKQEHMLRWNLVNFATRFGSLWVGGILQDARLAVFLFSSSGIFVYGYIVLSILVHAGVPLSTIMKIISAQLLLFLPVGCLLLYLLVVGSQAELRLLLAGVILAVFFLFLILKELKAVW
jgi:lipopolysaccharide exporter